MFHRNILALSVLSSLLAACGSAKDVRETLGLNRTAPDEFKVYSRPALTVPPEFNLRAPGSATDAPTTTPADAQARNAVLSSTDAAPGSLNVDTSVPKVSATDLPNGADAQFLQNAGAHKAQADVRAAITQDAENGLTVKDDKYLVSSEADGEPIVDATKESDRIKKNKAENKSPAEGETAVVKPKSKGILGTLSDLF
jgi:hypothetical protein